MLYQVKDVWRESCGFEAALAAISSLDSAFSVHSPPGMKTPTDHHNNERTPSMNAGDGMNRGGDNKSSIYGVSVRRGEMGDRGRGDPRPSPAETRLMEAEHFGVIQAALLTLVASASAGPLAVVRGERLVGYKANRRYLRREISYDSLACCLVNSGVVARCSCLRSVYKYAECVLSRDGMSYLRYGAVCYRMTSDEVGYGMRWRGIFEGILLCLFPLLLGKGRLHSTNVVCVFSSIPY